MHPLPNAVMTVVMGILVIYWLFVLLSGAGLDDLDLGFDFDVDVPEPGTPEVDADADIDASDGDNDVPAEKSQGFFVKFLTFLNVGKVPFMLILSTFKFFIWIGTLITTKFIDVTSWGLLSLLILLPLALISVFWTKLTTTPMAKLFKEVGYSGEEEIYFLGRSGQMLSNIKDKKIGTAEFSVNGDPVKLNVMSIDGEELKYGDYVMIADESDDRKTYLVSKELSIRNY
jgi:hypothetical protein